MAAMRMKRRSQPSRVRWFDARRRVAKAESIGEIVATPAERAKQIQHEPLTSTGMWIMLVIEHKFWILEQLDIKMGKKEDRVVSSQKAA
jgi:hypothetical protein